MIKHLFSLENRKGGGVLEDDAELRTTESWSANLYSKKCLWHAISNCKYTII